MFGNAGVWRVRLFVAGHALDAFAEALESLGGAVSWTHPEAEHGEVCLDGFFAEEPEAEALRACLAGMSVAQRCARPKPGITWLPPRDWLAENRRQFAPFTVGRFFVHGSEATVGVPPGCLGLGIDAGIAFGSGRHESTAGCLLALGDLKGRAPRRALDMGCGSGILSLAIARIWRVPVLAVDIDPAAVATTAANARRNALAHLVRARRRNGFHSPEVAAAGPYDLVVANIRARPLRRMALPLTHQLREGGHAILSGILNEEASAVAAAYRQAGLGLRRRLDLAAWSTLVLKR